MITITAPKNRVGKVKYARTRFTTVFKNILSSSEQTSFCIMCGKNVKKYPGGVDGDGELHQSPRPDDQDHHAQDFVGVHFVILQLQRNTLVDFKALKDSMDISSNHSS